MLRDTYMSLFRRRRTASDVPPDAAVGEPQSPSPARFDPVDHLASGPRLHPDPAPGAPTPAQSAFAATLPSATEPVATTQAAVRDGVDDPQVDPARPAGVEDPVPQVAPVSRSGRNMPVAAASGLILLTIVLVSAWWHPMAFAALISVACVVAVMEWRHALARSDRRIPLTPIVLATIGLVIAAWYGGPEGLVVALMVGCAGTVAWRVVDERIENTMADSLAGMMALLWIPFTAAFLVLMVVATDGWQRVAVMIIAVAGADTGGLFSGMLFGRRPMAPRVSPKKTWEGFAGGVVLGVTAASVASYFLLDGRWWVGALVGLACVVAAAFGDLAESALKRDLQVKDMSSVIPGHGGILDRIDSMLFAAPVAYVVFSLLLGAT